MMKYQFFRNTGVQFFGDSSKEFKLETNQDLVTDGINGSSDLSFSSRMFRGECFCCNNEEIWSVSL